jgi:TPR repeat protein
LEYPPAFVELFLEYSQDEELSPLIDHTKFPYYTWLEARAENEDAEMSFYSAICCIHGFGTIKDTGLGYHWLLNAARLGHNEAQYLYGVAHFEGKVKHEHPSEAITWIEQAAQRGNASAALYLGNLLLDSIAPIDEEKGIRYYEKAAQAGVCEAFEKLVSHFAAKADWKNALSWCGKGDHAQVGFKRGLALFILESFHLLSLSNQKKIAIELAKEGNFWAVNI